MPVALAVALSAAGRLLKSESRPGNLNLERAHGGASSLSERRLGPLGLGILARSGIVTVTGRSSRAIKLTGRTVTHQGNRTGSLRVAQAPVSP